MAGQSTYYQPTVELYKYNWWTGKWVHKTIYPSTIIFQDWIQSENYKYKFIERLKAEGVKLKEGNFEYKNAQLVLNAK